MKCPSIVNNDRQLFIQIYFLFVYAVHILRWPGCRKNILNDPKKYRGEQRGRGTYKQMLLISHGTWISQNKHDLWFAVMTFLQWQIFYKMNVASLH